MRKVLPASFFNRPTLVIAKDLLGKYLVRRIGDKEIALMITETEAYAGPQDLASHAHFGRTRRNAPMWGPPGRAYVYFTYGMHWMRNIVCKKEGEPSAVLIRGLELPVAYNFPIGQKHYTLDGPGKLSKFLHIDGSLSGVRLGKKAGLWIEDRGVVVGPKNIKRGPRVGVDYAGPVWAKKPWRFVLNRRSDDATLLRSAESARRSSGH